MALVSTICFCLVAYLVLDASLRKADFFSPARLYLFCHSLTLGVAFLALDKAMTPFKPFTCLIYFGSAAAFFLGCWITGLLSNAPSDEKRIPLDKSGYNWRVHMGSAFLLFFIFAAGMAAAAAGLGTVPMLAEDKAKAIKSFFSVNWYSSVGLSYGGVAMALFFMGIFRPRTRRKSLNIALWMVAASLALYALALSRSGLIFFALFAVVYFNYAVRRLSIGRLAFLFIAFFSLFMITGYLKLNNYQKDHQLKGVDTFKLVRLLMKFPYVYVANNFWNLDYALNPENYHERHPTTYGFTTVSGLLDMMALPGGTLGVGIRDAGGWDDQFHVRSIKVKGLNTMGYQWGLYKDFGLAGTLLLPFLFGMFIKNLYLRASRRPTVFNVAAYSYFAFFIGMSWFLAFWESMIYLYGLFYVLGTCYLAQRTAPREAVGAPVNGLPVPA